MLFHQNARRIVDDDGDEQDEDVLGHKPHVKHAACHKQHEPSCPLWQQIEQCYHNGQEDDELNGVEDHKTFSIRLLNFLYRRLQNLVALAQVVNVDHQVTLVGVIVGVDFSAVVEIERFIVIDMGIFERIAVCTVEGTT